MSNENPFLKGPRVQGGNPFLNGPRIPRPSPLVALGSPEYQARAQNLTRSRSHDAVTRVGDSIDPRVDYSQIPTDPRGMYGSVMGAKSGDIARTHDEFASDNRASLKQSALNVVGALPSMAAGLLSVPANYVNGLMQAQYAAQATADGWLLPTVSAEQIESAIGLPGFGKAMSEGVRASQAGQSDKLAAQRAEFDATDGAISAAHYLLSNPSFGLSLALEQAGQFATLATPGGATAKVLGGAALAGGMNANEVQQDLAGRVQRGEITVAEASRRASNAFGLSAAANTLIPKALGSNAMTLERIASGAARSAASNAGSTAVLRGAGRGFLGEGLQGGLSEVADGAVKNHYTDKPLLADAGKNFVLGFGLEAMPGAAGGAVETLQAGPPESAKPSDTLRSELLTLGEELAGRDVVREETRHVPSMPQRVQKDPGIVPEDASDIDALLMRNLPQRGKAKLVANPMPQGLGEQLTAGTVFDSAPPVLDATRIGDALAGVDFAQQAPKLNAALLGELLAADVLSRQPESNPEAPVAAGSLFSGEFKTEAPQGVQAEVPVKHSEVGQSDERPVTMQNRDRSRAASVAQMQSIRSYPDPERLGFSRDPNAGAPMVGEGAQVAEADKGATDVVVMASGRRVPVRYAVVEADAVAASHNADGHVNPDYDGTPLKALNNGRTAGLQAAWASGNADAYREGIIADARLHGVSPKAIAGKKRPMLVRLYDPAANTGDMGAESNASAQLGLSPVEQAQTDSRTLPDMTGIQFAEDGSISPASNAAFFRAWFHNIGATQAATLQDAQGRPNAQALQRLKGALVYQAYGDERLLTALAEDVNPERRNVLNAMAQAAPAFAALEQDNTLAQEAKVALTGALELLRQAGERGLSVQEMVAQGDMLGRNAAAETVALFMAENARSAKRMAAAFRAIAEHVDNAQMAAATHDIFGDAPKPTLRDSLEYANDRLAQNQDENTRPARFDTSRVKWPDVRADTASGSGQSQQAGRGRSAAENAGDAAAPARLDGGQGQQVSGGLFAAPTAREHVEAARRAKDAERDGRTGTGRTDMMAGDGELFAGSRPAQMDVEDAAQSEPKRSNRNESGSRDETGVPAGLSAVSTAASERLARALHAHLRRRGYSGKPPRFLEVLSTSLPHELHAGLQTLGRITGTRVVIFRNLTPEIDDFNGVNFRDGTVYINENNEYPVTLTAAHEWVHNFKGSHPELYQQLENEVRRQGRISQWHERNIREEGMDRGRDHAIEELTAAAVSDALTDPEFLQRLAERNRGLFRRVAEAFLDFLSTLIRGWRDQGSNQYLQDVEAFRDKLAAVLEALPENGAASGATDVDALFQRVWHGTPHRGIEKTGFKLNAIGTGEGAQAYGWGIYFASQRAVAEHYRKGLSYREQVRQFMRELPEDADIDEVMEALERGDLPQAAADVVRALAADDWLGFDYPAQAITAAFKELDNFDPSPELREAIRRYSGQLYQVEIPEDSDLLDWDKPLSEQPPRVRKAIEAVGRSLPEEMRWMWHGVNAGTSGKALYGLLGEVAAELDPDGVENIQQAASELLREHGIPGLRYLDGDSRAAGEGSHNYVIWDESLLTPEAAQIEAMFSRKSSGPTPEAQVEAEQQFKATERAYGGRAAYDKAKAAGKTKLTYGQWVQVRTPNFKQWFGDWEGLRAQERLDEMRPVEVELPDSLKDASLQQLRDAVKARLDALAESGAVANHPDVGEIGFSKGNNKKAVSTSAVPEKLHAAHDIVRVIESAVHVGSALSGDAREALNDVTYHTLAAKVRAASREFVAVVTVKQTKDGQRFYNTIAVSDGQEKAPAAYPGVRASEDAGSATAFTGARNSVLPAMRRVNPAEVSKVIDPETGEPRVEYPEKVPDRITVERTVYDEERKPVKRREKYALYTVLDAQGKFVSQSIKKPDALKDGERLEVSQHARTVTTEKVERTPRVVKEEVVFRMQPGRYGRSSEFRALVNGVEVGYLQTTDNGDGFYAKNMESKPDGFVTVSGVHVREPYRRLGIAAHMYRYAEQQLGEQIYPALAQYDDAKGFWRWRNTQANYGGYYRNAAGQIKSATGNIGTFDEGFDEIMFSRKAQTKAAYEARIDALFAGAKPQQPGVKMLDEADTLTITGYENLPVMLMERHAVVRGSEVHPLTAEQWKQVPDWIDNPAAMFERQRDGHITLIGPEKIGGKAVVIALKPEGMGTGGRGGADAHLALTAYAKDTGTMPLRAMVERGDMKPLYIDQKKASSFYAGSGVQFPGSGVELRGFNRSLKTERDLVKYRAERDEAMFSRREENIRKAKGKANAKREEVRQTLDASAQTPGWNYSSAQWEGRRGQLNRLRADMQDKMLAWRDAQGQIEQQMGQAVADSANVYRLENLMHGRVSESLDRLERNAFKPLIEAMAKAKVDTATLEEYLYALHAKERNASIAAKNPKMPDGGSGMSNAEAEAILARADKAKLQPLADHVRRITRQTRQRMLAHGLITQEAFDAMNAQYQWYVPLRGKKVKEDGFAESGGRGRGLDGRGKQVQEALGRGQGNRAENILANVFGDAMRAAINAEKARVGRGLMRLVLQHPNPDLWEVEPVQTERVLDAKGEVVERVMNDWSDPSIIAVRHRGQLYRVQIHSEPLAKALNHVGVEQMSQFFRVASGVNRYFSAVLTKYNPAFTLVNASRDALFGLTGLAAEHGELTAAKAAAAYPQAMRAAWRQARGQFDAKNDWDVWAREFAEHGGKTGMVHMKSVEDIARQIGNGVLTEASTARKAGRAVAELVGQANDAVENALRMAAYVTLRKQGMAADKAAEYAKNLTVNFNRKGYDGSKWNAWFLFYNASLQGSHRVATLMKKPKTWGYIGLLAGAQAVATMLAMGMEDEEGNPLWEKIPEHVKQRNLVIPTSGDSFATVPMPYGFNWFVYMSGQTVQAINGSPEKSASEKAGAMAEKAASALVQAFSPVPLDDGALGLLPTVLRIPANVQANRNDFGNAIRRENPYSKSDIPRASQGRADTMEVFKLAAKGLNRVGGGDDYRAPKFKMLLDWAPEDLEYLVKTATGGMGKFVIDTATLGGKAMEGDDVEVTVRDVPIINRFASQVDERSAQAALFYERRKLLDEYLRETRGILEAKGVMAARRFIATRPELEGVIVREQKGGAVLKARAGSLYAAYKDAEKGSAERNEAVNTAYAGAPAWPWQTEASRKRNRQVREADQVLTDKRKLFNQRWEKAVDDWARGD